MKTAHTLLSFTLLGAAANAATIVQTQNYSFTPTGNQNLIFNKFDTFGGNRILNSVTITTSLTKSGGSLYVDNDSATAGSGSISQTVRIDLTAPGVNMMSTSFGAIGSNVSSTTSYFVSLEADDGDGSQYQSGGPDWGGTTFADQTATRTEEVSSLVSDSFKGTGATFTINVAGVQSTDTQSISGASGAFSPASASGYVTVTYNYTDLTPVPEPASWLIVCGGLGAGVFVRRRRA